MSGEPMLDDAAPWKRRFRASVILGTQVARSRPERGLALANTSGTYQLYAWDVPTGELRQLTDRPTGIMGGDLSPDGRYVYYHEDQGGNEIGHYVRVPFEGGPAEDVTPGLPPYSSFTLALSRAGNVLVFSLALDDGFYLYSLELGSDGALGTLREVDHSQHFGFGHAVSYNGELLVKRTTERTGRPQYDLVAIDLASGKRVAELYEEGEASLGLASLSPLPDDLRVLGSSDRSGVRRPLIWDPRSGERRDLALDGLPGGVYAHDWSPDGGRLLLSHIHEAVEQLLIYDLHDDSWRLLEHPRGRITNSYFLSSAELIARWEDATQPGQIVVLDASSGAQRRVLLRPGAVPAGRPWRSVSFSSSDGQRIQGWLALPEGHGPFPTILETHGGPEAATLEEFSPGAQAWLDHGYAFLSINYRGSTTFGRQFQQQIWGHPGHWEVEDMAAAQHWLVEQGIARPDAIFLTGWSYGGYLTLLALGKQPELWAGGMAGIAIADWVIQYADSAPTLRGYQAAFFGGTPAERPEQYRASSPISYVEQVQAPVLVIQGRNDTRCPARPMERYEARLREQGKPIEVHWFEAGHGSYSIEQQIEHQALMLQFASRVLADKQPDG